jgi:hypothetical protein
MRSRQFMIPVVLLLAAPACMMNQLGRGPPPATLVLRVIASDSTFRIGGLVLADGDSLVLYDLKKKARFAIYEQAGLLLDVYRGQGEGGKAAAEGAGNGALLGAGLGALAGGFFGVVVGSDSWWGDFDVAKLIAAGAVAGALDGAATGALQGAAQGKPVWERITMRQLMQELCRCTEPK